MKPHATYVGPHDINMGSNDINMGARVTSMGLESPILGPVTQMSPMWGPCYQCGAKCH